MGMPSSMRARLDRKFGEMELPALIEYFWDDIWGTSGGFDGDRPGRPDKRMERVIGGLDSCLELRRRIGMEGTINADVLEQIIHYLERDPPHDHNDRGILSSWRRLFDLLSDYSGWKKETKPRLYDSLDLWLTWLKSHLPTAE